MRTRERVSVQMSREDFGIWPEINTYSSDALLHSQLLLEFKNNHLQLRSLLLSLLAKRGEL